MKTLWKQTGHSSRILEADLWLDYKVIWYGRGHGEHNTYRNQNPDLNSKSNLNPNPDLYVGYLQFLWKINVFFVRDRCLSRSIECCSVTSQSDSINAVQNPRTQYPVDLQIASSLYVQSILAGWRQTSRSSTRCTDSNQSCHWYRHRNGWRLQANRTKSLALDAGFMDNIIWVFWRLRVGDGVGVGLLWCTHTWIGVQAHGRI